MERIDYYQRAGLDELKAKPIMMSKIYDIACNECKRTVKDHMNIWCSKVGLAFDVDVFVKLSEGMWT